MWLNHLLTLIAIAILTSQFSCQMGGTSETGNARVTGSIVVNDCDTSTVWVHLVNEYYIPGNDTFEMVYKVAVDPQGEYHFDKVKLDNYYLYIKAREQNSLRGPISISAPDMELGKDTLQYTSIVSVFIPDSFSNNSYNLVFIRGIPEGYVASSGIATLSGVPSGQIDIIGISGNDSKPFNDTTFFKNKISLDIKQLDTLSVGFNNSAPQFDGLKKLSQVIYLNCSRVYQDTLMAHDPDSDLIIYKLSGSPQNMHIDSLTGIFFWTVPDSLIEKAMSFSAVAMDNRGASRTTSWSVTFSYLCINDTVRLYPFSSITPDTINPGDTVVLNIDTCFCSDSSIANIDIDWGNSEIKNYSTSGSITYYHYQNDSAYYVRGRLTCTSGSPSFPDWFYIDSVKIKPDTTVLSLILNGPDTMFTFKETPFTDPGAKVVNEYTGDTIASTFSSDSVNYYTSGKYTLSYSYDSSKTATRTVYVISYNSTLPTFTPRILDTTNNTDSSATYTFAADSVRTAANSPFVRFSWNDTTNYSDTSDWSRNLKKAYSFSSPGTFLVSVQFLDLNTLQYSKWSPYTVVRLESPTQNTTVTIKTSFDTLHPYEQLDLFKIGSYCAGNGAELTKIFWGDQRIDSSFSNEIFHHSYTSPGQYSIEVRISCDSNPLVDTIFLNNPITVIMGSTIDSVAPSIQLTGNDTIVLPIGATTYTDPGATATDDRDGNLTASLIGTPYIDFTKPGEYYYLYTVTDTAGNKASAFRKIIIQ